MLTGNKAKERNMRNNIIFYFVLLSGYFFTCAQSEYIPSRIWTYEYPGIGYTLEVADVNRDGKEDIFLGNWNTTAVYYKNSNWEINTKPDIVYAGRVLVICDYNGDGYKDMVCMHLDRFDSTLNDYHGELWFYMGKPNTPLLFDTIPDFKIPLPTVWPILDFFGYAEYTTGVKFGDFNGDHKMDIVISEAGYPPSGRLFIYMGCDTPKTNPDFVLTGNDPHEYLLGGFFDIADMNGDGFDDLIFSTSIDQRYIGKPCYNILHIFDGSLNPDFTIGKESLIYKSLFHLPDGDDKLTHCGWFTGSFSVNDVNGDGIPDLIIGSYFDETVSNTRIHLGKKGEPIDTVPSIILTSPDTNFLFSSGVMLNVGDVNADGYDDFIITPCGYDCFALILGGKYISSKNPIGIAGFLARSANTFPNAVKGIGKIGKNSATNAICMTSSPCADSTYWGGMILYWGENIRTGIDGGKLKGPENFQITIFPNPFNPSTTIAYEMAQAGMVTVKVYDILGREIAVLLHGHQLAGKHQVRFDATQYHLASGTYICEVTADNISIRKKMIYIK